jgi:hypothetical protein
MEPMGNGERQKPGIDPRGNGDRQKPGRTATVIC